MSSACLGELDAGQVFGVEMQTPVEVACQSICAKLTASMKLNKYLLECTFASTSLPLFRLSIVSSGAQFESPCGGEYQ